VGSACTHDIGKGEHESSDPPRLDSGSASRERIRNYPGRRRVYFMLRPKGNNGGEPNARSQLQGSKGGQIILEAVMPDSQGRRQPATSVLGLRLTATEA
jgi:hypothetical protein